jgi:hypothetical protein
MTKQQLLDKLQSSEELVKMAFVPVSEVINWIKQLETGGVTSEMIDEIADAIESELNSDGMDLVRDYDLSMSYREVELDSIEFDGNKVQRIVKSALENYLEEQEGN